MKEKEIKRGNQRFYIGENETATKAEITWVPSGNNVIIVDHTHVSEELRGQGIAQLLVDQVATMAREEGLTIIPTCPYAKKILEGSEKYSQLLEGYGGTY